MTLAYVFWHWPSPAVAREEYERWLESFHGSLDSEKPPGYRGSAAFSTTAPWLPELAYEDWYLIDGFEALGALNDAAVNRVHGPRHDPVAANVADGAGALYRLRQGAPGLVAKRHVAWLTKPRGTSYAQFHGALDRMPGLHTVWARQLVLGPGREFCVRSVERVHSAPGTELVEATAELLFAFGTAQQ